jgi:tRNA (cytidine/uridine-2'-O-)-methyltransferase
MLLHVVLVAPEIAPNTGNIIRLCANTGAVLHLVEPLGFSLGERSVRRAGLDYHELAEVHVHLDLAACRRAINGGRWYALTTRAARRYDQADLQTGDVVVFGPERAGLDEATLGEFDDAHRLGIPMRAGSRSLNLANAVSVVVYEVWRQNDFAGAAGWATSSEVPGAPPFR